MLKLKDEILSKIPKPLHKYLKYIVILIFVAILLLCLSIDKEEKNTETETSTENSQAYARLLEENIANTVKSIVGGKPTVMVTLKSGTEYIYANEEKLDTDEDAVDNRIKSGVDKKIVTLDDNGTEIPLTVTEIMPSVSGIVIVCNGGNDNSIKELIRNTVSVALGIQSDCVCVTGTLLK